MKKGGRPMNEIVNVCAGDDYKLLIEFEDGSRITYNMQKLVGTLPYFRLKEPALFRTVKFDNKSVYWDAGDEKPEYFPLRFSIDSILFSLRG